MLFPQGALLCTRARGDFSRSLGRIRSTVRAAPSSKSFQSLKTPARVIALEVASRGWEVFLVFIHTFN